MKKAFEKLQELSLEERVENLRWNIGPGPISQIERIKKRKEESIEEFIDRIIEKF